MCSKMTYMPHTTYTIRCVAKKLRAIVLSMLSQVMVVSQVPVDDYNGNVRVQGVRWGSNLSLPRA